MSALLAAVTPTPEQLTNGAFWIVLVLLIAVVLGFVWAVCDHLIDRVVARQRRQRGNVVDFTERRKLNALLAIGERR